MPTGRCPCEMVRFQVRGVHVRIAPYARLEAEPELMRIRLGMLDQDPGVRSTSDVRVEEKAAWLEIDHDLPRFPRAATNG